MSRDRRSTHSAGRCPRTRGRGVRARPPLRSRVHRWRGVERQRSVLGLDPIAVSAYANAMLCASMRCTPAALAAATRFRVPSRRMRLVPVSCCLYLRGSSRGGRSVSSWITAAGFASATAPATASPSSTSQMTAVAPSCRKPSARRPACHADDLVTVANSIPTSVRPITPHAPARNTLMVRTIPRGRLRTCRSGGARGSAPRGRRHVAREHLPAVAESGRCSRAGADAP